MKKTITSSLFGRIVGGGSLALMLLIGAALLLPVSNQAKATTNAEAYVGVRAATMIGLYLGADSVSMDMVPASEGVFSAKTLKFGVETNSEAGYRVLMSTLGGTNSLVSTDTTKNEAKYMIPSITTETAGTNFTGNAWGYTVGATDESAVYKAVPSGDAAEIVITETSTAGQRDEYDLTFGAHIDTGLPAGNYGNTVLISVVANAEKVTNLNQVTYMQDITPEVCANTPEGTERQLYDVRDGQRYWVARMKDGRCWMIQNLAFDIEGGKTYTAADTDLANTEAKSWTVPVERSTEMEIPEPGSHNSDNSDVRSWNLGKIVFAKPTDQQPCANVKVPEDGNKYDDVGVSDIAYHGQNPAEVCPEKYKNVEGWSDGFNATTSVSYYENATTGVKSYDARYLIGSFYQYGAATAGTGVDIVSPASASSNQQDLVNATGSICPKGWMLPKSGQNMDSSRPWAINGSFTELLMNYGYSVDSGWQVNASMGGIFWPMNEGANLAVAPFYFVRTGRISPAMGRLNSNGVVNLWSSTAYTTDRESYMLFVGNTVQSNVYPSYQSVRYLASPVRCISVE